MPASDASVSVDIIVEVSANGTVFQRAPLGLGTHYVGRDPSCEIVLESPQIALRQLRIERERDSILLFNMSPHDCPILVNGRAVVSTVLDLGDLITLANYSLHLVDAAALALADINQVCALVHKRLVIKLDLKHVRLENLREAELRHRCEAAIDEILIELSLPPTVDRQKIKTNVLNEALGLGPLEDFLADDSVTEIMVNNKDHLFIERSGKLHRVDASFTSNEQVINVIARIVNRVGRRIDESNPMVDARLKDGSRVNAIIPPLSLGGPMLDIRKFSKKPYTPADLVRFGSMTSEISDFLKLAVLARQNIIISGGTGSGKTTLLNVLSGFIPAGERVLTIEDSAELQLPHENLGSLEARPANVEGRGEVKIRDLVRNALRMRPDRIVVGECRAGEALDMLQAMNTGHDGSLTTLHANSPEDAILRTETMVLMSGLDLPSRVIRAMIASAVNFIVQQSRLSDGSRRIMAVSEITGMAGENVSLENVMVFKRLGIDEHGRVKGHFEATGYVPEFVRRIGEYGLEIDMDVFTKGRPLK
jgi:pilus assembly protein CpaF